MPETGERAERVVATERRVVSADGAHGCADQAFEGGQLLEFGSTEISVEEDFPAWCRMTGNELVSFVRRGKERSFLVCKGALTEHLINRAERLPSRWPVIVIFGSLSLFFALRRPA